LADYARAVPFHKLCTFVHSKPPFLLVSPGDRIQGRVGEAEAAVGLVVADNLAFVEIVVALVAAVDAHIQVRVGGMAAVTFLLSVQTLMRLKTKKFKRTYQRNQHKKKLQRC
jgi:hypothetical protein